jgi:hypothetical protein
LVSIATTTPRACAPEATAMIASTPDRDGPDAYVTHDPDDAWAYVVLPVPPGGTFEYSFMPQPLFVL